MCGICGMIMKDGRSVHRDDVKKMCDSMIHRGPDDEGFFFLNNVGLGMRRLKIIDLETGHQPIHNENKRIWVVLNGEIYNFYKLRNDLEKKGHLFYTKSDTEVIVHLYEEYGLESLELLNGMFCFALWDSDKDQLHIARDRLGIKQIYYYENEKYLVFGSELKVITSCAGKSGEIDYHALSDYFSLQYIPAPKTIFSNIRKLPPASFLSIRNGKSNITRYWSLGYEQPRLSGEEAVDVIDNELKRSVMSQMVSDVPLGVYLSGGIDSSLLVAMMARATDLPVETFSIIWDAGSKTFDERRYARFVAEKYRTHHHEFLVKPEIEEVINNIINAFDEPFADDSAIPNYYIARETKRHVTVALSGLGGDEMSAGYERYLGMKLLNLYRVLPQKIRANIFSKIIQWLPDPKTGNLWIERMKRFVRISDLDFAETYFCISSKFEPTEKNDLFNPEARKKMDPEYSSSAYFHSLAEECLSDDELDKMLYIDMNTYMVDQLLVLSDRMSMAHSLELRVPYLDHILVEAFARVEPSMKIRGTVKKYLLKKVAERYFPREFIYRKKMGFSSPVVLWLRNDLKKFMLHILNRESVERTHIINPDVVQRYITEHVSCRHNHDMKLWSLIIFMLWYNSYIEKIYV